MANTSEHSSDSKNVSNNVYKALHIDDDEDFLLITKIHLEEISEGILQIDAISSPKLVFDQLKKNEYNVIICDYQMPELSGLDVLKKIRSEGISLPFIIFTGKGREEVAIQALNLGADYYIKKGTDIKSMYSELFNLIIKAVTQERLARALERSETIYKTIFENTGTATVIIESDTVLSLVNSHFELLSGYPREEIEGKKSWTEFVVPEDLERMKKYHRDRRKNSLSAPTTYNFRFIDKEDNIKDILLRIGVIPNTLKSVASLVDVTEMKQVITKNISLNKVLMVLRNVNQLIIQEKNRDKLIQKACNILQGNQSFGDSWIILLDDSGKLITFAESGENITISLLSEQMKKGKLFGACKKAFRKRKLIISDTTENECDDCPIYDVKCRYEKRIILPLIYQGTTYGLVSASLSPEVALNMDDISLLSELASDIAFALFKINLEEQHEKAQEEIINERKELESEK